MGPEIAIFLLDGFAYGAARLRTADNYRENERDAFERWFGGLPTTSELRQEHDQFQIQTTKLID